MAQFYRKWAKNLKFWVNYFECTYKYAIFAAIDKEKTSNSMNINQILNANSQALYAVNLLLPQLTGEREPISIERLSSILKYHNTRLYVGYEFGQPAGMYALATTSVPSGDKVWLEDVVVLPRYRGKGFGRQLVEHAINEVKRLYPDAKMMLTSRPTRVEANYLYSTLFKKRDTNVYTL